MPGIGDVEQGQGEAGLLVSRLALGDALQRLGRGRGADGVIAGMLEDGGDVIE